MWLGFRKAQEMSLRLLLSVLLAPPPPQLPPHKSPSVSRALMEVSLLLPLLLAQVLLGLGLHHCKPCPPLSHDRLPMSLVFS